MRLASCAVALVILGACHKQNANPTSTSTAADAGAASPFASLARIGTAKEGSLLALAKLDAKRVAIVADEDGRAVRVVDLDAKKEMASTPVGGRPGQIAITNDGKLLVTVRDEAKLAVYRARQDGTLAKDTDVATNEEPLALALADDTVLVATGFSHTLQAFGLPKLENKWSKDVAREPRAVTTDGKRAFVTHASSGDLETVDLANGSISKMDLGVAAVRPRPMPKHPIRPFMLDFAIQKEAIDPNLISEDDVFLDEDIPFTGAPARFARQAFAMTIITDPKGGDPRVIISLAEVAPGDARIVSSGYGGGGIEMEVEDFPSEVFDLTVVDPSASKRTSAPALTLARGKRADKDACRLPRGIASTKDTVVVACLGSNSLVAYDATKSAPATSPKWHVSVPAGPSSVAIDPDRNEAFVLSSFDLAVSSVSLGDAKTGDTIPITRAVSIPQAALEGRKLFHSSGDARISKDGRACASCHPDARDDGLVWSTPDGPRQTIFLAGRVNRKGPYGWMAEHASLQTHMQTTMKNLKGNGLETAQLDQLSAYLQWVKGPPRSFRQLTPQEERGKEIFESGDSSCASCHDPKNDFSDHASHDVKSAVLADRKKEFLAPSLFQIGTSAPYFHDGRYATLEDLIDKVDGTMGYTKYLSPTDKQALAAYLRTL